MGIECWEGIGGKVGAMCADEAELQAWKEDRRGRGTFVHSGWVWSGRTADLLCEKTQKGCGR